MFSAVPPLYPPSPPPPPAWKPWAAKCFLSPTARALFIVLLLLKFRFRALVYTPLYTRYVHYCATSGSSCYTVHSSKQTVALLNCQCKCFWESD
jgi:hypothetical protein